MRFAVLSYWSETMSNLETLRQLLVIEQSTANNLQRAQSVFGADRTQRAKRELDRAQLDAQRAAVRIKAALQSLADDTSPEAAQLRSKATGILAVID